MKTIRSEDRPNWIRKMWVRWKERRELRSERRVLMAKLRRVTTSESVHSLRAKLDDIDRRLGL